MKELLKNKWAWAVLILVVLNIASIGFIWCSMCCKTENMGCKRSEMCHPGGHCCGKVKSYHHGCERHTHGDMHEHMHGDSTHMGQGHCKQEHHKSCCSMPVDSVKK